MSACSAACTAEITCGGATPAASSRSGGIVYQTASVVSVRGGTSSGTISMRSFVDARRALVRDDLVRDRRPMPTWTVAGPNGRCSSTRPMSMSDVLAGLGVLVVAVGVDEPRLAVRRRRARSTRHCRPWCR